MADQKARIVAARAAKAKAKDVSANIAHVCGIGITFENDRYAVKVNLEDEPAPQCKVPALIDGVPVVVHVVGRIRKQAD